MAIRFEELLEQFSAKFEEAEQRLAATSFRILELVARVLRALLLFFWRVFWTALKFSLNGLRTRWPKLQHECPLQGYLSGSVRRQCSVYLSSPL
jgi:hypothetical protein